MSIFESLAAEIERLQRSPHIEVRFEKHRLAQGYDGLPGDVEALVRLKLPPSVVESLQIDDHLHVYWRSRINPEDAPVFGEFFLFSVLLFARKNRLDEVFLSRTYGSIEDMRKMRVFDRYAYNGGPIYSLLQVIDGRLDDRVFVFNERDVFPTTLTYESYLNALLLTRGFLYWQYLFCESPRVEPYEVGAIERGLTFVEQAFPANDYSDLRRRLAALQRLRQ